MMCPRNRVNSNSKSSGLQQLETGPKLVSAWAADMGLLLGQRKVDGKSNGTPKAQTTCWA